MSSSFKDELITRLKVCFSSKRLTMAVIMVIIGLVEVLVAFSLFNTYLESTIKGVFILVSGLIEVSVGIAGLTVKFKDDFERIILIVRYVIIILVFIPYVSIILGFFVSNPVILAFKNGALLFSVINLVNLFTIPVLKHFYEAEY